MHMLPHLHGFAGYISLFTHISYPGIFLALLASGHVIPIPEGATLVLLGYIAGVGVRSLHGMFLIGIFSVLFFDMLMYLISWSGSSLADKLLKKVRTDILERYRDARDRDVFLMVVLSHFIPGWRFANPIIAGVAKVEWKRFFLFSIIAACIYAPLYISIGFFFHSKVFYLLSIFKSFDRLVVPILMVGAGLGILLYVILENRKNVYNK